MRFINYLLAGCLLLAISAPPARADSCQDLRDLGDTLRWAIPVTALGLTGLKRDGQGAVQMTKTAVLTGAWTGTFKAIGDKTRPDARTSRESFVSGHVSGATMGAAFMYTRYGKAWGIPAYGLAMLTAYSRVCSSKHFADDVLGGMLVAMFSNWYATSPHPDLGRIYPSFTSNGLELSWSTAFGGNREAADPVTFKPRYRFVFEFGPVVQDKNLVRTPNDGGTTIDLADLATEYHMTARMIYELYLTEKSEFTVWYGPMGMTDFGDPTEPFTVGDTTFDPSDPDAAIFDSNYRWIDWRFGYRYNLVKNDHWTARVGASLQYSKTQFEVEQRNDEGDIIKGGDGRFETVFPLLHLSGAYRFNDRWSIEADFDGMSSGSEEYLNAGVFIRWRPSRIWDLAFGGRLIDGKIDDEKFYNDVELSDFTFQIGRSF
jgi:membrane-associated phospholipid phosphatase